MIRNVYTTVAADSFCQLHCAGLIRLPAELTLVKTTLY